MEAQGLGAAGLGAAGSGAAGAVGAGADSGAGGGTAGSASACAIPLAAARDRLAPTTNAPIIAVLPEVAVLKDFPFSAAPSSRIPTKRHHPHRPRPGTR